MVLLAVSAVAVVATGGLAGRLGRLLGIGSTAITVWDIAKWPVLLLIVGFLFALLYWASPTPAAGSLDHPWQDPGRRGLGRDGRLQRDLGCSGWTGRRSGRIERSRRIVWMINRRIKQVGQFGEPSRVERTIRP
jgi:hypothetical protein